MSETMADEPFKEGDVVQLKSGGPAMVVFFRSDGDERYLGCVWFDAALKHNESEFPTFALRRYDSCAEPFAWKARTPVFKKYVTDSWYRKARPAIQRWYEPICSHCGVANESR